jgi:hypothetical protein
MDLDSKDMMVVELEPETDVGEFAEETSAQDQPTLVNPPAENSAIVIGKLSAWDDAGNPLVNYPNNPSECFLPARTTVALNQAALGHDVALMFVDGDPRRPLIIGLLQPPKPAGPAKAAGRGSPDPTQSSTRGPRLPLAAEVDGERLVFTADKDIVLKCGESSLTLTRAGKVLIRGTYLLSRSSGVNRIQGGSIQLN